MQSFHVWRDVATPYFAAQVLTAVSTSVPHAILTPLLLAKGLTLAQILVIQAAFSVAVLLCEFPSGALADVVSRRWVYVVSRLVLCVFFLMVVFGASFPVLLVAWVVYGAASALDTGTLDAALVNNAKNTSAAAGDVSRRVSWLVRKERQSTFLGMMVGSVAGAMLYLTTGVNIYFVSVAAALLAVASILLFFHIPEQHRAQRGEHDELDQCGESDECDQCTEQCEHDGRGEGGGRGQRAGRGELVRGLRQHMGETLAEMKSSPRLQRYLVLSLVVHAFMQLHMQLWQAVALEKGFTDSLLIILYLLFMGISFLGAYVQPERLFTHRWAMGLGALLFAGCVVALLLVEGRLYVLFYGVLVVALVVLSNFCAYRVRTVSSLERIGAVTSLVSVCGRVSAVVTLLVAAVGVQVLPASTVVAVGFLLLLAVLVVGAAGATRTARG